MTRTKKSAIWYHDVETDTHMTEFSDWSGNGCPDPVTGKPISPKDRAQLPLSPRWESGELVLWQGCINGVSVIIVND